MRARSVVKGGNEDQQHDDRASDNPALPYATHMFDLRGNAIRYHGRAARNSNPARRRSRARDSIAKGRRVRCPSILMRATGNMSSIPCAVQFGMIHSLVGLSGVAAVLFWF